MNKIRQIIQSYRHDGTDPRKNDAWRVLLFSLNYAGGAAITSMMGKWSYYTQNVLQLGIMFASIHLPIRLLDAVTDPLIANLFDKYNKKGKFRLFMIIGAMMSFVPALVVFFYPVNPDIPLMTSYVILGICYAIIIIGNTILLTATRAGQAIITQDPKQRPLYALGQTVSDAVVSFIISIVVTSNLIGNMQDPLVWRISIVIMSAVSIVFVLAAAKAIGNRDLPIYYAMSSKKTEETKITEFFKLIKRSKPLRSLLWATCSDSIAKSVRASLSIYLFANIIMNRSLNSVFDILNGVVLGAPVLVIGMYFASKQGSAHVYHKVSLFQTIIATAGFFITLLLLPPDPNYTYNGVTFSVVLVILMFGGYISSLGISTNLENAMVGDLTDYEYLQSGKFIPGTIGAALTFVNKIASSGVGIITMAIMSFCGFSGNGAEAVVPENVFINYRFYYCVLLSVFILPALGHLVTYIAMRRYPLTDEVMQEVSMKITAERGLLDKEETTEEKI